MGERSIMIVIVVLGIHGAMLILQGFGVDPLYGTPGNVTQMQENYNSSDIVESWDWREREFYDVGSGFGKLYQTIRTLLFGVPTLFNYLGAPSVIVGTGYAVLSLLYSITFIEIILGRQILP